MGRGGEGKTTWLLSKIIFFKAPIPSNCQNQKSNGLFLILLLETTTFFGFAATALLGSPSSSPLPFHPYVCFLHIYQQHILSFTQVKTEKTWRYSQLFSLSFLQQICVKCLICTRFHVKHWRCACAKRYSPCLHGVFMLVGKRRQTKTHISEYIHGV